MHGAIGTFVHINCKSVITLASEACNYFYRHATGATLNRCYEYVCYSDKISGMESINIL